MMVQQDFPLFPLGIVALPYEAVPLHIFEPRYREMVSECLESGSEFGIVWASEDGLRQIGCACEIAEVLERHEDGRIDILTRGTRPFRLVEAHEELPYPTGGPGVSGWWGPRRTCHTPPGRSSGSTTSPSRRTLPRPRPRTRPTRTS